ncbi:MAG: LPS assembly lipoprotein LptE [Rhodospirillales bacterium]|nr:LPS assembly lipoprotein LptE [Rhodospirillales bacterium]
MLSFNCRRRITAPLAAALLGLNLSLGACGFKPLYGHQGNDANSSPTNLALAQIDVEPIIDRSGQKMRTALQRRLSPKNQAPALYTLTVELSEGIADLAIDRSAFATRANLSLSAQYRLVRNADGLQLNTGNLTTVASYNILTSNFATHAARTDARNRAIETLADDIQARLALYFAGPVTEGIQPQARPNAQSQPQPAAKAPVRPPRPSIFGSQ